MENKRDIKREMNEVKFELGLWSKTDCTAEENQKFLELVSKGEELPKDIRRYVNPSNGAEYPEFYRVDAPELSPEELNEYLQLLQCKYLRSIKSGVYFFVTLTVISLILGFILAIWGAM